MKKWIFSLAGLALLVVAGATILTLNTQVETSQMMDGQKEKQYFFGKLAAERIYKNGELDGLTRIYYPDGKIKSEWNFKNGMRKGTAKHYTPEGNLRFVEEYVNNKRVSRQNFDKRGNVISG